MKLILLLSILFGFSLSPISSYACESGSLCLPKNVTVSIYGTQLGPKQEDYDLVRNSIAELIADVQIKKYVLVGTGIEGGFTVCLESINSYSYHQIMSKLSPISGLIDRQQTSFSIKNIESCN